VPGMRFDDGAERKLLQVRELRRHVGLQLSLKQDQNNPNRRQL